MAPSNFGRRRVDRRRNKGRGTYAGPERRVDRNRRGVQGRRGYDRRRNNGDEEDYEGYYYAGAKKQQNPMVYFGIAGGAILLIIIIAVAASGSSKPTRNPRFVENTNIEQIMARAQDCVMQGGRAYDEARRLYKESGQSAADPYYEQAYQYFDQAHRIYEDLDRKYPNTQFYQMLSDVENTLGEIQKSKGIGGRR
jgi:hypothetical protein